MVFFHFYSYFNRTVCKQTVENLIRRRSFYSYFNRTVCKQTVENLIRRCVLRGLIWFCTVCRFPIKRTLGLYGLNVDVAVVSGDINLYFDLSHYIHLCLGAANSLVNPRICTDLFHKLIDLLYSIISILCFDEEGHVLFE